LIHIKFSNPQFYTVTNNRLKIDTIQIKNYLDGVYLKIINGTIKFQLYLLQLIFIYAVIVVGVIPVDIIGDTVIDIGHINVTDTIDIADTDVP